MQSWSKPVKTSEGYSRFIIENYSKKCINASTKSGMNVKWHLSALMEHIRENGL